MSDDRARPHGEKPKERPLAGQLFHGTRYQRRCIDRWQSAGWAFLHWTEIPQVMAVLASALGDIVFIDENGWAWEGPRFNANKPVPREKYPPIAKAGPTS